MGAGDGVDRSSETFTIFVAVRGGADSERGVGELLLGAVLRVGVEVEVRAGVVEVVLEVEVEAWTWAWSSAGVGSPVEVSFGAAGLL